MRTSSKYLRISKCSLPIKYMRTSWNICAYPKIFAYIKIFASMKYSRPWIFAPMKYSCPWNIRAYLKYLRIYEIYAPHQECSRLIIYDSNKAAIEISAAYKRCWRPEMLASRLLLFGLGRISNLLTPSQSGWRALVQKVLPLLHAVLKWDLLSDRPAYMGGVSAVLHRLLYRHDLPKCSGSSNVRGRRYFDPLFWEKSKT